MESNKVKTFWNETWLPVPTKAPTKKVEYFFSNHGRLKSVNKATETEILLKGSRIKGGYVQLNIRLEGNLRQGFYVHKLVADPFCKRGKDKGFIIHLDNDKENNFWKNLQWVNQEELTAHQIESGVYLRENRKTPSHQKMTESKVLLLKKRLQKGNTKRKILAKSFNITETHVRKIEDGTYWGHVKLKDEK